MGQEPAPAGGQEPQAPAPTGDEPRGAPQEPKVFDEDYVKKLRGEAAGYRTRMGELEARLQEFEDRDKSDLEKVTGERDTLKGRAETAESQLARFQAASKAGLPLEHAHRISGTTPKELEEDAKKLAESFGSRRPGTSFDSGARESGDMPQDMNSLIRRSAGRT